MCCKVVAARSSSLRARLLFFPASGETLCVTTLSHERTRETTRSLLQSRRFTVVVSARAQFLFFSLANYIAIDDGRQAFSIKCYATKVALVTIHISYFRLGDPLLASKAPLFLLP